MSRSDPVGSDLVGGAVRSTAVSPKPIAVVLKPTVTSLKATADRGMVTAEAAVVIPTLVMFVAMLLWGLMAVCAQIQCVDAARTGARAAARSEPEGAALATARAAAPRGARVALRREGDLVRVRVEAAAPALGPLAMTLRGEAVALDEETVGR